MADFYDPGDLDALARDCLVRAGVPADVADIVARDVALNELDGASEGGFLGLLRDIRLLRYGRLRPQATPRIEVAAPSVLRVDAEHGFAAAALAQAVPQLIDLARGQGMAVIHLRNASEPGPMAHAMASLAEANMAGVALRAEGAAHVIRPRADRAAILGPTDAEDALASLLQLAPPAADTPLGGPVAYSGWIAAMDPNVTDVGNLLAGMPPAPPVAARQPVALPSDLLAQIVNA
ncbi:Ldh family oxidoreductase [Gymnodinialimonas sp. 2305UL16-5]|uniref:Ldh family oxidoreductase n=1 Tax=Gymnodinialimonas mytili TaxID=3126503 RepID=UPI00309F151F